MQTIGISQFTHSQKGLEISKGSEWDFNLDSFMIVLSTVAHSRLQWIQAKNLILLNCEPFQNNFGTYWVKKATRAHIVYSGSPDLTWKLACKVQQPAFKTVKTISLSEQFVEWCQGYSKKATIIVCYKYRWGRPPHCWYLLYASWCKDPQISSAPG